MRDATCGRCLKPGLFGATIKGARDGMRRVIVNRAFALVRCKKIFAWQKFSLFPFTYGVPYARDGDARTTAPRSFLREYPRDRAAHISGMITLFPYGERLYTRSLLETQRNLSVIFRRATSVPFLLQRAEIPFPLFTLAFCLFRRRDSARLGVISRLNCAIYFHESWTQFLGRDIRDIRI